MALAGHDEFGFDVRRAIDAGVDILNCSGWFQSQPLTDLAKIRRLAPGAWSQQTYSRDETCENSTL